MDFEAMFREVEQGDAERRAHVFGMAHAMQKRGLFVDGLDAAALDHIADISVTAVEKAGDAMLNRDRMSMIRALHLNVVADAKSRALVWVWQASILQSMSEDEIYCLGGHE